MSGRAAPGCGKAAAAFWCRRLIRIERQLLAVIDGTDGRTPDRYIDPAPHAMRAVSDNCFRKFLAWYGHCQEYFHMQQI